MLGRILAGLIRAYQVAVSSWTPPTCRFIPSCSAYALEAVRQHGAGRGGGLAVRRLLRCHPWGGSGYDPVPPVPVPGSASELGGEREGMHGVVEIGPP